MASQNGIACLLIFTGVVLLAVVNQLTWLFWLIPLALLFTALTCPRRAQNDVAREIKKG
jgi:hypothetical protein